MGEALEGRLVMDETRRELATMAYYVANCSWFLPGVFNPHPGPFQEWNKLAPDRLMEATGAREVVNAMLHDEDVPFYIHEKNMAAA
jgi:hypothetical protein